MSEPATKEIGLLRGTPARDRARDLLSGMLSGFICKLFEYPFDTVKVLQQTQGDQYGGAMDCIAQTYRSKGFMALYQGLTSPLLGSMAECATLFVAYGAMKDALGVNEDSATLANPVAMWKYAVAGGGSGICSAVVLTPVELVKCKIQVQQSTAASAGPRFKGPVDCAMQIVKAEGVQGLWKGNLSCLAREIPGNVAWFGAYEAGIRAVQMNFGYEKKADVPLLWNAVAGAGAGVAYWGVPYPADTIKSKIQTDPRFAKSSFTEVFKTIVKEEGVAGLYRGVGITCLRAAPSHAAVFQCYAVASAYLATL